MVFQRVIANMHMRGILINLTWIGKMGPGTARFAQELLSACEQIPDFQRLPVTYLFGKGNYPIWNAMSGRRCYYLPNIFSLDKGMIAGMMRYLVPPTIFVPRGGYLFTPCHQGNIFTKRQIVTVHDVIPLRTKYRNGWQYLTFRYLIPIILKRASYILSVSETTKNLIIKNYAINPDKIKVISNAVDHKKFTPSISIAKQNNLLVIGAFAEHKNTHELITNHVLWSHKYKLDIISRESSYLKGLKIMCHSFGIQDRVNFIPWVDDETLVHKYRQAKALIYPSLEEGFGIPPLEAMCTNTPVVISDIPVHREVCGDAGIYITPGEQRSWQRAFDILDQEELVNVYVSRGLEHAKQFSWDNSARQFNEFLKSILH
jgi:glycosyltransferase involved in cell wall biosynthesis